MCTGLIVVTTMTVSRRSHSGTLNLSVAVMIPVFVAAEKNTKGAMAPVADAHYQCAQTRLRVSIFVDVQSIYNTCRQTYSRNFDYNKFWAKATGGREVVSAYAYATDRGDEKQQQFQSILRAIGFTVLLKPFVQRSDGSNKGDWDVGIALDVYESAPHCDTVVLASGDGDFEIRLRRIGDRFGTRTEVYGVFPLTAAALRITADKFVAIEKSLLL